VKERVAFLLNLIGFLQMAEEQATFLGMKEKESVVWAVNRAFQGDAHAWWVSYPDRAAIGTIRGLVVALGEALVGPQPFDVVVLDFQQKSLKSFQTFDAYLAWLQATVLAMQVFASDGNMWPDPILIQTLLSHLMGTEYHEGVATDPNTNPPVRPTAWPRAVELLKNRHHTLLALHKAHGQVTFRPGGGGGGGNTGGGDGGSGRNGGSRRDGRPGSGAGKGGSKDAGKDRSDRRDSNGGKRPRMSDGLPTTSTRPNGLTDGAEDMCRRLAPRYGISPETAAQRMLASQCIACGSTTHRRNDCPRAKAADEKARAEAKARKGSGN
jgi:uncharacterized membrane protein YgcG